MRTWYLEKVCRISSAHHLENYKGPCANIHGHNWIIKVRCKGNELDKAGMLIDFTTIKKIVNDLDHTNINDVIGINPTAENLAQYLQEIIPHCYEVEVEETEGSKVTFREE